MNEELCVVIPVYNEGPVVRSVVEAVLERCPNVVCVDDGSADDSYEQLRATRAHVVRHPLNLGQGAALQTGIEYGLAHTACRYFATFDSDGQHEFGDIERMLATIQERDLDVVLGSRFLEGGRTVGMKWLRRVVLAGGIWVTRLETGLKLTDTHNGLRVFTRRVARELDITEPGMTHASEILRRIADKGYRYEEIPVTVHYSDYSMAKGQSLLNAVNIGLDIVFRIGAKRR